MNSSTRTAWGLGLAMAVGMGALAHPGDALACGGCFGPPPLPSMSQQVVTDHRMVLSIGATESVLWDQIRYSGAPSEFSWVLPVSGDVTVELGSSLFIDTVDSLTTPVVVSPPRQTVDCGCAQSFYGPNAAGSASDAAAGDAGAPPVTVVSEATVGPYETVTLRSMDAAALTDWLNSHNYVIPASMQPVIQSYVDQHMDFVALRLLPGEGVDAMQPVKIRYHTASMVLPLRMVGAGIAEKVGLTLHVFGLGRHEAANFGNGQIDPSVITWNWDTGRSDYADVFQSTLRGINNGRAWITQYASAADNLDYLIGSSGQQYCYQHGVYDYNACSYSGYLSQPNPGDAGAGTSDGGASGGDAGTSAQTLQDVRGLYADWQLATGNGASGMWLTRMRTDLLAHYLDTDLIVQPSTEDLQVSSTLQAGRQVGTAQTTCTYHSCPGINCATAPATGSTRGGLGAVFGALAAAGALAFVGRRKN